MDCQISPGLTVIFVRAKPCTPFLTHAGMGSEASHPFAGITAVSAPPKRYGSMLAAASS